MPDATATGSLLDRPTVGARDLGGYLPHIKHIDGRLWEMWMKGKGGISRALYVAAQGQRVIMLRVLIKKTEKTPRHEIDLALARTKLIKATEE